MVQLTCGYWSELHLLVHTACIHSFESSHPFSLKCEINFIHIVACQIGGICSSRAGMCACVLRARMRIYGPFDVIQHGQSFHLYLYSFMRSNSVAAATAPKSPSFNAPNVFKITNTSGVYPFDPILNFISAITLIIINSHKYSWVGWNGKETGTQRIPSEKCLCSSMQHADVHLSFVQLIKWAKKQWWQKNRVQKLIWETWWRRLRINTRHCNCVPDWKANRKHFWHHAFWEQIVCELFQQIDFCYMRFEAKCVESMHSHRISLRM